MSQKTGQSPLTFINILLAAIVCGVVAASSRTLSSHISIVLLAAIGVGLFFVSLSFLKKSSRWVTVPVALLFFVLGAARFLIADALPESDISKSAGQNVIAAVTGTVVDEPVMTQIKSDTVKLRYVIEAKSITNENDASNEKRAATGRLYVTQYVKINDSDADAIEKITSADIGDSVTASGHLRHIRGYKNPGTIDIEHMTREKGITARLSVSKNSIKITPASETDLTSFVKIRRAIASIRRHYKAETAKAMSEADASAIFAMLFGGYEGVREELTESFTTTGIVHILSVSGSHITLLASVVALIGATFSLRKGITMMMALFAIASYVALAGFVPPAVRSGIMGTITFLGIVLARERDARHALTIAAASMLLISPFLAFDLSFMLSFASTAGLLYLAPAIRRLLMRSHHISAFSKTHKKATTFIIGSVSITVAAQLATLPIIAWYFHVVSLSSLIANLVIVPIVEAIIVVGLAAGLVAFILPFVSRLIFAFDALALGIVYESTRLLARLPMSQIYMPTMTAPTTFVYYALMIFALQKKERRDAITNIMKRHAGPLIASIFLCAIVIAIRLVTAPSVMRVHFIDVGQGDAALIVTPHGHALMVDTGGTRDDAFDTGGRVDVPYLLHYGVRRLDYVLLTHVHEDHAAGAGGILKKLPIDTIVTASEGMDAYQQSMKLSSKEMAQTSFIEAREGATFSLDGVTVETLYAPRKSSAASSGNELSNVYRVSYGDVSFIFTGDLVKEQESRLIESATRKNESLKSTVLKVGHHGSHTSSSMDFLRAVSPRYAVISDGYENSFGHPHDETLKNLDAAHIKHVYRTDLDGAIVFTTDGTTIDVETYRETHDE